MWLIWIDADSKYGNAEQVSSANGFNTVRKLQKNFSMLGDSEQIKSDNGTLFTYGKFGEARSQHGIRHIRSATYHAATNGKAERFVQMFNCDFRANSDRNFYSSL